VTWRPEIIAALTGVAPASVPAWGFGARGAGHSFDAAGVASIPEIRAADAVAIQYADATLGSPENPFQQTDGREYAPAEVLVVDLPAGGWVEYEFDVAPDPEHVRVVDEFDRPTDAIVERSARGLRVIAGPAGTRFARLRSGGKDVGIVGAP
jgi:hypothetical protein